METPPQHPHPPPYTVAATEVAARVNCELGRRSNTKPTKAQRSSVSQAAARQASQQVGHMNTSLRGRQEEEGVRGGVKDRRNTEQDSENVSYRGKEGNK